jgi:hypothetical protein
VNDPIIAFLDDHETTRRLYLGDALYAGMGSDGMCWLVTQRAPEHQRDDGLHYIGLDEGVARALIAYLRPEIAACPESEEDPD